MWTLLLACAAAAPRQAVIALSDLHADACGAVHGTVEVRPRGRAREVELRVGESTRVLTVPARAESVPFDVFVGADLAVAVSAGWRFVDTDEAVVVTPPWDVGLVVRLPREPPPADQLPPLEVEVTGCDGAGLALAVEGFYEGPIAAVPLDLPVGATPLTVRLSAGGRAVAEERVIYEVGPPCTDADGDGHLACRAGDCDDADPAVHPGAEDVVGNGVDDDCDGRNGRDADRDGFEAAAAGGDDCDDHERLVNPAARRFPDADGDGASALEAVDFDCDGDVDPRPGAFDCDDADPTVPREEAPLPTGRDEDCDGLVDEGTVAFDDDGDGLAELDGDCDDADDRIRPGAPETADCRDEDCDGVVDDGVVRPARDDRYEPNDEGPVELPGARWRSGFFGGSWRPSRTEVRAVTRDLGDVERFVVYAHDGDLDTFHVSVRVDAVGDDRSYEITVSGPRGVATGVVTSGGQAVGLGGRAGRSDSGDYTIEVRPLSGELAWCPLDLVVGTG